MRNATIGTIGSSVFSSFGTVYRVSVQFADGSYRDSDFFDDVLTMRNSVQTGKDLPDSVRVYATRYREGLTPSQPAYSNATIVVDYSRQSVPSPARFSVVADGQDVYTSDGQDVYPVPFIGTRLTAWQTVLAWPIVPSAIVTDSVLTARENALSVRQAKISEFIGNKYREAMPEFSLDNVDDNFVLAILLDMDKLSFEVLQDDGETKTIRYNPIKTNFYRKHGDRFARHGYDGENLQTIAKSIFATIWLESRRDFPDSWTAVTYRDSYVGKIRSARWINARVNAGMSFSNSQEWMGRKPVRRELICENQTHFILLLSSYAMARAIQEIVQPFKMESDDMKHLKASNAQAIVLENVETLTQFEQDVANLIMTDHTERQAAEKLGVERTKIRQAKMKIKNKMAEFIE
tara:strand:- start:2279 stop:3493 length:1215 start_codon:yes stop_codon:yes gene_type:complete